MSHDKIRAAARRRMTAAGETYAAARRRAISEHNSTRYTAPISAEDNGEVKVVAPGYRSPRH